MIFGTDKKENLHPLQKRRDVNDKVCSDICDYFIVHRVKNKRERERVTWYIKRYNS